MDAGGQADGTFHILNLGHGLTQGDARVQVESDGHSRKNALMIHLQVGIALPEMAKGAERNRVAGAGGDVNVVERLGILLEPRIDFYNDVVLVDPFIHYRDLALTEGIVKNVVDGTSADAQTAGGVAVNNEIGRQSTILEVGVHVLKDANLLQF